MEKTTLKKQMGFLSVFSIASGAMISSGLFILPGIVYDLAGPAVVISYLIAGLLMIPTVFTKAELTTAMPKSGGTYFFAERSLGTFAGVLSGFANWFSISLKSAFALIGMGAFLKIFYPDITYHNIQFIAVGLTIFFMILNILSVKSVSQMQIFLVIFLLISLFLYCIVGYRFVVPSYYKPFFPKAWQSIFTATGMVFISFGGITKIASVGEEIKNPGRNVPWGMISALIVVGFLYVVVVDITVGLVPSSTLKNSLLPLVDGAKIFWGTLGIIVITIAGMIAFITTANAGILSASRVPLAMSRDGITPGAFQLLNRKSLPYISIFFTSGFMMIAILLLDLKSLVKLASTLMLLLFLTVNLSLIMMRESKIPGYRPKFKAPLYPWIQIFAIGFYGFLIIQMGRSILFEIGIFIFVCFLWYLFYVREKVERKSALMYIIDRIISPDKELVKGSLEEELKDIIWVRDEITQDRFDTLIKDAKFLDIQDEMTRDDFFRLASKEIAPSIKMSEESVYEALQKREMDTSTVIHPGLAIPHIITPGEGIFTILVARAKNGISFSPEKPPVKAIFLLAGSRDERNFYLRALMAIAQIAQDKKFDQEWDESPSSEDLRNLILFSSRKRGV